MLGKFYLINVQILDNILRLRLSGKDCILFISNSEQIFWTLAERQKTNFKKRSKELHDQVRQFRHDLESRQLVCNLPL